MRPRALLPLVGCVVVVLLVLPVGPVAPGTSHQTGGFRPSLERSAGTYQLGSGGSAVRWGANTTTYGGVSLSFGLAAHVDVPTGNVEPGRSYATGVGLQTNGDAELDLSGLGFNRSVGVPALGPSAKIPITGANYSYYGVPLNVYVVVNSTIVANCTTAATALGCPGGFTWASSGDRNFTLALPGNASPDSNLTVGVTDLALSVSLALTAEGTVPILGNISIPLGSPITLPGIPGSPPSVTEPLAVVAPPEVLSFTAAPNPVIAGHVTNVSVELQGGAPPFAIQFADVPSGCNATNLPTFTCEISAPGNYTVSVTITDGQGASAQASTTLAVQSPPPTPPVATQSSGGSAMDETVWVALGAIGGAVAVGLAAFLWSRRSPRS